MTGAVNKGRQNQERTWFTLAVAVNGAVYESLSSKGEKLSSLFDWLMQSFKFFLKGAMLLQVQCFLLLHGCCQSGDDVPRTPHRTERCSYQIVHGDVTLFFLLIWFRIQINTDQTYN